MFDSQNALNNPPLSRAQRLSVWCFCAGLLLNGLAAFTAPHHAHRPIWIAIDSIALGLVIVGVVSGGSAVLRKRALRTGSRTHQLRESSRISEQPR
jgi:hypothetical protein